MTTAIVVDDDESTVNVFTEFLQLKGIKVLGKAYDGMQAVELYQELKPQVIFLDVMMDRYDGFYALERIKAINQEAFVIMVTADLTKDTDRRLHDLNASAIIYKPYEIDQIIQVVQKLVSLEIGVDQLSENNSFQRKRSDKLETRINC